MLNQCIYRRKGTLNAESTLTIENSTANVDHTDALSEASGQQPPGTSFGSTPIAVPTYMDHNLLPGAHPDVSLPPVPPRMKEKIISSKFTNLATLLPKAMFLGRLSPLQPN